MTMSVAIFSSLLNITGSCCVPTWPTIWLLWRRIARNILMWLIAGSRINKTTELTCSVNRAVPLSKAWATVVTKSQDAVVMNAALFESVEKIKENFLYPSPTSVSSSNTIRWTNKGKWMRFFSFLLFYLQSSFIKTFRRKLIIMEIEYYLLFAFT